MSNHTTYYYRIRQVDLDGKFEHSSVIVLSGNGRVSTRWAVWPNPLQGSQPFHVVALKDLSVQVEAMIQILSTGFYGVHLSNGVHGEHFKIVRY